MTELKEIKEWSDSSSRLLWVWNDDPNEKWKAKVVYITDSRNVEYPVVAVDSTGVVVHLKHCAEINEQSYMTYKQLARWLHKQSNREAMYRDGTTIYTSWNYSTFNENKEATDVLIRENDGQWQDPLMNLSEN